MATQNEHGKLIAAAAKAALAPLGCVRIGQSRRWISDQRIWAISIEFRPRDGIKGSGLAVSAIWFWYPKPGLSLFRYPTSYIPFENAAQFVPWIDDMAKCAASEVIAMRERLPNFAAIHRELTSGHIRDSWPALYTAIACALIGDVEEARNLFRRIARWRVADYDWEVRLRQTAAQLAAAIDEPSRFRLMIDEFIAENRMRERLPPDPHCLDDALDPRARH